MENYELTPDEMYLSTSEKILRLNDTLSTEIIFKNIEEQLTEEIQPLSMRINYVSLFREKYEGIKDTEYYDENEARNIVSRLGDLLYEGLLSKYDIDFGTDQDFMTPIDFLYDMETLYEFLFIRHFENLTDYFKNKLNLNKQNYIEVFSNLIEDESHSKDLFVLQSKKKFKNKNDILILHFMNDIINNIRSETTSAYSMFDDITKLDLFEEYNNRMSELIINLGNKLVLNNDHHTAELYLEPLDHQEFFSELRNNLIVSYLENCELND